MQHAATVRKPKKIFLCDVNGIPRKKVSTISFNYTEYFRSNNNFLINFFSRLEVELDHRANPHDPLPHITKELVEVVVCLRNNESNIHFWYHH